MKFKEALDLNSVIFCDDICKIFDNNTASTCLELEKTIQDFWNVDRKSAHFINLMVKLKNSKNALEIGTSNGYSTIWIAKALKQTGGKLTTIEYWQKRMDLALDNFKKTGVSDIITPIIGDAIEVLKNMKETQPIKFDFIFIDANKAEYIEYLKSCDFLLQENGVIIADNILSHYHKTKNYIDALFENKNYQNQILNIDAGMMVSFKNPA